MCFLIFQLINFSRAWTVFLFLALLACNENSNNGLNVFIVLYCLQSAVTNIINASQQHSEVGREEAWKLRIRPT